MEPEKTEPLKRKALFFLSIGFYLILMTCLYWVYNCSSPYPYCRYNCSHQAQGTCRVPTECTFATSAQFAFFTVFACAFLMLMLLIAYGLCYGCYRGFRCWISFCARLENEVQAERC